MAAILKLDINIRCFAHCRETKYRW